MLTIEHEQLNLSPEARKFLPPAADPARMMAAKGMAPLSAAEMLTVQAVLTSDVDERIAEAARSSIANLPENILRPAVEGLTQPMVLDRLARSELPAGVREALALNRHLANETLVYLATTERTPLILDILAGNQSRMMAHIAIAEALLDNPQVSFATKKRLEEFFMNDFTARILGGDEAESTESLAADFALALGATDSASSETPVSSEDIFKQFIEETSDSETPVDAPAEQTAEEPVEEAKKGSLYSQILGMKMSHKIKLALTGNKEARSLLVKDSNKMVCLGVLKNPRITDGEIITIANSKSAIEDLLRNIASNSQWTRHPAVKSALVHNAKTPVALSLKFIPYLRDNEIAQLSKSKGVPGAIQIAAKRMMTQKASKR
jgi:hypothetical protein